MRKSLSAKIRQFDLLQQSNSFMYFLYSSFLFRKFFHSDLVREYEAKEGIELAFNSYNFLNILTRKIFYLLLIYLIQMAIGLDCFGMFFILLTVAGAVSKNIIALDSRAYNNVILMHVDPRKYAITVMNGYLMREALAMAVAFTGMSWYLEISIPVCLVYLAMYLSIHLAAEVVHMYFYVRNEYENNSSTLRGWLFVLSLLVTGIMIFLLLTGRIAVTNTLTAYGGLGVVPVGILAYFIMKGDINYKRFYRFNLTEEAITGNREVVVQSTHTYVNVTEMNRNLKADEISSSRKGYDFLFQAFMSRYRRTFLKGIIIKLAVIAVGGAVLIAIPFFRDLGISGDKLADVLFDQSRLLIYIIYWFSQSGKSFIITCFMQIDRFLIHYSFFRKSDAISRNFGLRVMVTSIITLIPSIFMIVMIALLCLIHGVSGSLGRLAVLAVFVIVMSVFYGIYNVAAYYLLHPYGFDGQIVNKAYSLIDAFIYILSYLSFEIRFTLSSTLLTVITVILAAVSVGLYTAVIKVAPKSFRVR